MGSKNFFDDVLQIYSSRASDLLETMLNNDHFIQTTQKMLIASVEFKDFLQSTIGAALEQFNIPSRADTENILTEQQKIIDRLDNLEIQMQANQEKLEILLTPKKKKAAKKSPKAKTTRQVKSTTGDKE